MKSPIAEIKDPIKRKAILICLIPIVITAYIFIGIPEILFIEFRRAYRNLTIWCQIKKNCRQIVKLIKSGWSGVKCSQD